MNFICGVCFNESNTSCYHWAYLKFYHTLSGVKKGFFEHKSIYSDVIESKCQQCCVVSKHIFSKDTDNIKCGSCSNNFTYSKKPITSSFFKQITGKYRRKECTVCNGSGMENRPICFELCLGCHGYGGAVCNLCNGQGHLYLTTNDYYNVRIKKCSCDNGYRLRCNTCNGEKTIPKTMELSCSHCINK